MLSDPIDVQQFIRWLKTKWTNNQQCPVCQHDDWIIVDKLFELKEQGAIFVPTPSSMPVASVICKNCGNTLFFNAFHIKLLVPPQDGGTND